MGRALWPMSLPPPSVLARRGHRPCVRAEHLRPDGAQRAPRPAISFPGWSLCQVRGRIDRPTPVSAATHIASVLPPVGHPSRSMAGHARANARRAARARRHDAALGRAVQRGQRRAGRGVHQLDRDRPRAGGRRHLRLDRARARARPGRAADRRAGRRARHRAAGARRGRRRGPLHLGPGARGRPPQPRVGAGRARRTGRGPAPHRPVAQRPGRHGPPPLDAPFHRSP